MVGEPSRMPRLEEMLGSHLSRRPSDNMDPEKAVGYGAIIQGAHRVVNEKVVPSEYEGMELATATDTISLSIGVSENKGMMREFISKGQTRPASGRFTVRVSRNEQSNMEFRLCEFERIFDRRSRHVGTFVLQGFPLVPQGTKVVEITIKKNEMGQLTAKARASGCNESTRYLDIRPERGEALSQPQIARTKSELEEYLK
ncbi:hypothetical protein CBR_g23524 [Chara braunii]|uniref:Uncharacterized protein n=1 Tax=Chara braunii TaxID=69332 RepID=A0A388L4M6_CHABU|nr:hypothetical protein CBR_g23524 [Chara braunii]|eukprot:GBG77198.1 hypothetical protein CBR_g23524 [Chara braunii]